MKLWISQDKNIFPAPSIPHFKGLGMRNLQYESRICQKNYSLHIMCGSNFYESDFPQFTLLMWGHIKKGDGKQKPPK